MAAGLQFYRDRIGFAVERGGPEDSNVSLSFGDARLMLEVPADFYSESYNSAIRRRMGNASPHALYMEAPDIDVLYGRVNAQGIRIVDPLADRPWGQREFTVEDHEGNWLTFWEVREAS
jgi:uncharacterized glyoxalase superfamily protein PhnB